MRFVLFASLVIAGALILAGCNGAGGKESVAPPAPPQVSEQDYVRSAENGGVSVDALWLAPQYVQAAKMPDPTGGNPGTAFLLTMTTHSGDLLSLDLGENAQLEVGGKQVKPSRWEWTNKDSHHPEANLFFPAEVEKGDFKLIIIVRGNGYTLTW